MALKVRYADGSIGEVADPAEALEIYRHSAAHLMAAAVCSLFPDTHLGIGPAVSDGFFYDFDRAASFSEEDLASIEAKMRELASQNLAYEPSILSKEEAVGLFSEKREDLKVELIEERAGQRLSCYLLGSLVDFCLGPHVYSTGLIHPDSFRVLSLAGSHWKGEEGNRRLQRIYGTAFLSPEELQAYLAQLEEAKKRDHRKLGRELDLFSVSEEAGPGLIFWHPKGTRVRLVIEDFLRQVLVRRGYEFVTTPHIARNALWRTSGHYDYYRENMYVFEIEDEEFVIKPMNCPGHIQIYKSGMRSYRDLPLRFAEFGTVYRHEKSGVLHGMLRVRGFTQDDAHIFCTREQVYGEISDLLDLVLFVMQAFAFDKYQVELSVRDESRKQDYAGTEEDWQMAEDALVQAMSAKELQWKRMEGEAVFYGPKIDVKLIDAIGRPWQLSTVQFDFTLPKRFDLAFIGPDGQSHQPVMLHRALLGSVERFMGVLIEHYAGAFPIWLAPVQVAVIPIAERHQPYGRQVLDQLANAGLRVELDDRNEKMGYKIREAQARKVPFMLIVGDKEMQSGQVSVRSRFEGDKGAQSLESFIAGIRGHIESRSVRP
jgi:threonyl-tRNA synthetase